MTYLRNTWYLAAWSSEVRAGELFQRRLLDESLVLYRLNDGSPAALQDRCPHRFAPLHKGRIVGDSVQCPYHGLQFSASGRCVLNPQRTCAGGRPGPVISGDRTLQRNLDLDGRARPGQPRLDHTVRLPEP